MGTFRSWIDWAWSDRTAANVSGSAVESSASKAQQEQSSPQAALCSRDPKNKSAVAYSIEEAEAPDDEEMSSESDVDSKKYRRVCDLRRQMLDNDPTVKFMLEKLNEAGCNFPEEKIVVAECEPGYLGRYLRHELELCHNNFQGDSTELKNTIVHELIHAYDECRAKDFDWANCRHLACSEIRAARLSGDCSMAMELARGNVPLPGYEKACVRRRAELSVKSMPQCRLSALAAVLSNFDACYNDTDPFVRPP